jgi:arylsulfatase A-like enzyme
MKTSSILALAPMLAFPTQVQAAEAARSVAPAGRPNILFILADDLRWNALGCMGNTQILTPHIDRLARQGVLFKNHFVTTSICCCSRASILTGQYARRHGIGDFAKPLTDAQWAETYPALLRQAGYRTGFIGKFGVGNDRAIQAMGPRFDYWRGLPAQGGNYFIEPGDPSRTHATARFGTQALEFLQGQAPGQPFCLSISFTAPHARDQKPREFTPDDRDEALYAELAIPQPATANDAFFERLPKSVQTSEARKRWQGRFDSAEKFQRSTKDYYRLISGIDREVGRILTELATRGLSNNTVVIFTSDNGFALGDRGLADKWFMYEESLRVPLILCDPRQPAAQRGRTEDAMTLNIDFAPTLLEFAGLTPPAGMQGCALIPLMANARPGDWRDGFFYEHHFGPEIIPPSEGVRTDRWAYIRWVNENPPLEELYDVRADPLEAHDLAKDPEHATTLAQLRARWEKYRETLK